MSSLRKWTLRAIKSRSLGYKQQQIPSVFMEATKWLWWQHTIDFPSFFKSSQLKYFHVNHFLLISHLKKKKQYSDIMQQYKKCEELTEENRKNGKRCDVKWDNNLKFYFQCLYHDLYQWLLADKCKNHLDWCLLLSIRKQIFTIQ